MTRHDPPALIVGTDHRHGTVTVRCPYCRCRHQHALNHPDDRHRAAPCGTPAGYWITPINPPRATHRHRAAR